MSNLKHLQSSYFQSNLCINDLAFSSSEIAAFVQKLKSKRKRFRKVMLIKDIELLKEEIADLKNKNNQKMIEMNSKSSEIIALKAEKTRQANSLKAHVIQQGRYEDSIRQKNMEIGEMRTKLDLQAKVFASLQDENAKLKQWLKSCDGNLNAVTGILIRTRDRQQIFTHASESLDLIVEVEGSKFTANELVISSPGLMKNSVKNVNGSDVENAATEVKILRHQTLFLPSNLGQHFALLQVLAVTSSGLIQIDSRVFGPMKTLKILNLNSNKLHEIQPGTFNQLKPLESLDL